MLFTKYDYSASLTRERVKKLQKDKGIKNSDDMMKEIGVSVNAIRQMSDNKGIGCFALARIADRLETTTDYLLGRSDIPNMNISVTQTDSIIESSQIGVVNNTPERTAPVKELDEMTTELVKAFKALSFKDKLEIMNAVMKKSQK